MDEMFFIANLSTTNALKRKILTDILSWSSQAPQ